MKIWKAVLILSVLLSATSYSQFVLDNTLWNGIDSLGRVVGRDQTWSPNWDKMANVWRNVWEEQLPAQEVRLRPNQYFEIFIDGKAFRVKLLNVTGLGNNRISHYQVTYSGTTWVPKTGTNRLYFRTIGTVFPVNLQNGGATIEARTFQATVRDVSRYYCNDSVYVTLRAYDADYPTEGQLVVNGNTLNIFGAGGVTTNDQLVTDVVLPTPKAWWVDGTNNLQIVHTTTNGFRIDTVFLDSRASWFKKDTTYTLDSISLPYTNFGEADLCGNIKTPSDSLHRGAIHCYYFRWMKYAPTLCPDEPLGAVVDSVHERLQISPVTIGGAGSTTMVYLKVRHSEIPFDILIPPLSVAALPTRRTIRIGG